MSNTDVRSTETKNPIQKNEKEMRSPPLLHYIFARFVAIHCTAAVGIESLIPPTVGASLLHNSFDV
jgi:hypothetical protein